LPSVGWPAFSIHDPILIAKTMSKLIKRLKGNYGFKLFLRDGAGHLLENPEKPFYDSSEVKNFDNVENEYPIYFIFMAIYNIFTNNLSQASYYYNLVTKLLRRATHHTLGILPHYYYVPKDLLEMERLNPGSQERMPRSELFTGSSHLWTQAVWVICQLLVEKVLIIQELDPLKRYLQPSERPRQSKRYSSFKIASGFYTDLTVQVCCIAESVRLQQMLLNYGIVAQTPHQIEPIEIWPPGELVKAYEQLGINSKLGISGRPSRPVGVLGTSKLYRICSQTVLCYPLTFEITDFYMSSDLTLLLDNVRSDLEFLSKCWKLQGRPIYIFLIREQNLRGPHRGDLLELLSQIKQGKVNDVSVRMERLQTLIPSACLEHLDFLGEDTSRLEFLTLKELETDNSQYKSLSDLPKLINNKEVTTAKLEDYLKLDLNKLINLLQTSTNRTEKSFILYELSNRYGMKYHIDDTPLETLISQLSSESANVQDWSTVRFCTSILKKTVDSLAPSITNILVRGKILTLGVFGQEEVDIFKPLSPDKIKKILYDTVFTHDINQAVLIQELIINIGMLMSTQPEMFDGIMKLRLGWVVQVMKRELELSQVMDPDTNEPMNIYSMSPNQIKQLLHFILTCNNNQERTIYQKRQLDGALNRVPMNFYEQAWFILNKSPNGIKIFDYLLPQQPTLSDMTDYELNFSIKVEEMLSEIDEPVFRQICIEMFVIIYTILCRNPELKFTQVIEVDKLVEQAIGLYSKEMNLPESSPLAFYNEKSSINTGTSAYLSRVCIEHLLKTPTTKTTTNVGVNDPLNEASCKLS
jgi:phosphorylase kinase alpha/beta subunit